MSRCTQQRAWQLISALGPVDAGRLTSRCLRHNALVAIPPGTLTPAAAQTLQASVYAPAGTPITAETIFYVVSSDRTPVAWLTYDARVVLPAAELTDYQRNHQKQAAAALSQLTRHAVQELAKLRDLREQRTAGRERAAIDTDTRILVAAAADPTLTWWAGITGDLSDSLDHLLAVTTAAGSAPTEPDATRADQILIIDAVGYGDYGRYRRVFDLAVLCAVEQLTSTSQLPGSVIGDWLHEQGATAADLTAKQVVDAFTSSYAGLFETRRAFAEAERDRHGWNTALIQAGIPLQLFDLDGFSQSLFSKQVTSVRLDDGRIAVFRRHPQVQP